MPNGYIVPPTKEYFENGDENADDLVPKFVICDDINLPFGTLRMKKNGSAGCVVVISGDCYI